MSRTSLQKKKKKERYVFSRIFAWQYLCLSVKKKLEETNGLMIYY